MSQQLVARPQGIITEPNKVGQFPPGAWVDSSNVVIHSFGAAEQVPKWSTGQALVGNVTGGAYALSEGPLTLFLYESGAGTWYISYAWYNQSTGSLTTNGFGLGSPYNSYITSDGRTGVLLMRNRLIVAGTVRSFAIDFIQDTSGNLSAVSTPRVCGVYQPTVTDRNYYNSGSVDQGGVLNVQSHMTAAPVHRMVQTDGYELISPPGMLGDYANLSATFPQNYSIWSTKNSPTISSANHKFNVDMYRTREQSVGYDNVNNNYIPVSCGSSLYLSKTLETNNNNDTLYDTTTTVGLGEALVTNNAVGGATAYPFPPLSAKTAAQFKGHAFYANVTDPAELTLLNPVFWGAVYPATAPGLVIGAVVGTRTWTAATATSGNPTVTGIANGNGANLVANMNLYYYRTDTGALVMTGKVASFTNTTITSNTNSSYSGSVTVIAEDVIELNGTLYGAKTSAAAFAASVTADSTFNQIGDITAVALEPSSYESTAGAYPSFAPTGGLRIRRRDNGNITIRATNGGYYSPELPLLNATVKTITPTPKPNQFNWSENNEPENCPPSNFQYVGIGEVYKIVATRDCLWFFCSDGLFRLSGSGGSVGDGYDWVLDPVDPKLVIVGPNCACVHREYVYAYTNRGFVSISSEGQVREISDGRINPAFVNTTVAKLSNRPWSYLNNIGASDSSVWLESDRANDDIWIRTGLYNGTSKRIWVYNTKTDTFSVVIPTLYNPREVPTLGVYNGATQEMYTIFANRSNIHKPSNGSNDLEEAYMAFQPVYGTGAAAPHTLKHWQDLQLSFKTPQPSLTSSAIIRGSGANSVQQSRLIPAVSSSPNNENARVGFTIARNFPATSNAFSLTLFITAHSSASPITLEAFSLNYIEFTSQRDVR